MRFQKSDEVKNDKGALSGPFLPRYGRSALARRSANWKYLGISLLGVSPGAPELYFHWSPELGLGVHCTPNLDGLVYSGVALKAVLAT
jgi:hypothetical protein